MIACKHGRDEIVKELLTIGNEDVDDAMEDEEENKPKVSMDIKNKHTKAAIHYAAKNGHLVSLILFLRSDVTLGFFTSDRFVPDLTCNWVLFLRVTDLLVGYSRFVCTREIFND